MGKTGRARVVCAGDTTADPSARVVGYGKTWARGGFRCESRRRGLTCENAADHGFFLSAQLAPLLAAPASAGRRTAREDRRLIRARTGSACSILLAGGWPSRSARGKVERTAFQGRHS